MNKFSILKEAKYFWQEYLKNVWHSYELENNTLNILVALLGLIHGNLMEWKYWNRRKYWKYN